MYFANIARCFTEITKYITDHAISSTVTSSNKVMHFDNIALYFTYVSMNLDDIVMLFDDTHMHFDDAAKTVRIKKNILLI